MFKACIFDLDGTIADTLASLVYSTNAALRELGFEEISPEQCRSFVGSGARNQIECSLRASGDSELYHIEEAMEAYHRIFAVNCTYKVTPYEGVVDTLNNLKEMGVKLAVLSNKPHPRTVDVIHTVFGKDLFDWVQGQQDGIPRKPNPASAVNIAEEFGLTPEECVYVGDSDVDMQTGNNANMETVGVTWGFRTKEVLIENGAKHIIDKAEELITIIEKGRDELCTHMMKNV